MCHFIWDIFNGTIQIPYRHNPSPGQSFWSPYLTTTGAWPSTWQEKPSAVPSCMEAEVYGCRTALNFPRDIHMNLPRSKYTTTLWKGGWGDQTKHVMLQTACVELFLFLCWDTWCFTNCFLVRAAPPLATGTPIPQRLI